MHRLLLALACLLPLAAHAQTPFAYTGRTGAPAVAGDPLKLSEAIANGSTKCDLNASACLITLPSGTVTLPQAITAITPTTAYLIAAGTTQGTATPVTARTVYITGGGANAGIILVSGVLSTRIINTTTTAKLVYPTVGGAVNGSATNAAVLLPANGGSALFSSPDGLAWSAG